MDQHDSALALPRSGKIMECLRAKRLLPIEHPRRDQRFSTPRCQDIPWQNTVPRIQAIRLVHQHELQRQSACMNQGHNQRAGHHPHRIQILKRYPNPAAEGSQQDEQQEFLRTGQHIQSLSRPIKGETPEPGGAR
ncbi:MAG: hypothetical protein WCJ87_11095, partial [Burkholderiales bacterium]